ncbi:MAG: PKD domain-containing protein, partial [Bacteroidales bacterium]|nr:PKD domain-containing protein [Bacteroidales bacterium]
YYSEFLNENNSSFLFDSKETGKIEAWKKLTSKKDSYKNFVSFGFNDNKSSIGFSTLRRYHYTDSSVAEASLPWQFWFKHDHGYSLNTDLSIKYLNPSHIPSNTQIENLRIWHKGKPNEYGRRYFKHQINSGFISSSIVKMDSTLQINTGNWITLGDTICENPPPINVGTDQIVCSGDRFFLDMVNTTNPVYDSAWEYTWYCPQKIFSELNNSDSLVQEIFTRKAWVVVPETDTKDSIYVYGKIYDLHKGCVATDTIKLVIQPSTPIDLLAFNSFDNIIGSICPGDTIFYADTTNADDTDMGYTWVFDGDSVKNQNHKASYLPDSSSYTTRVSLVYENNWGCISSDNKDVHIHPLPELAIKAITPACSGNEIQIENHSRIDNFQGAGFIHFDWKFSGNRNVRVNSSGVLNSTGGFRSAAISSLDKSPNLFVQMDTSGWQQVTLRAMVTGNCQTEIRDSLYINPNPLAFIDTSLANHCLGIPSVLSTGNSTQGNDISYTWRINDGMAVSTIDTTYTVTLPSRGMHHVALEVKSDSGCSASTESFVQIYPGITADFSAKDVCDTGIVTLINHTPGVTALSWNYGDGSTGISSNHQYADTGSYNVQLWVQNSYGCTDSTIKTVTSHPLPQVSFTVSGASFCQNNHSNLFSNTSESGLTHRWEFGDLTHSSLNQPDKRYTEPGNFMVTLTGINQYGCSEKAVNPITIHPSVPVDFDPVRSSVCEGRVSDFAVLPYVGTVQNVTWNFGDGTNSGNVMPNQLISKQYDQSGEYSVQLISETPEGCFDSITQVVVIAATPVIDIIGDTTPCAGEQVGFEATPNTTATIANTYWTINDSYNPKAPQGRNAWHQFDYEGNYLLTARATSQNGCEFTDSAQVQVYALPTLSLADETGSCTGSATLTAGDPANTYAWSDGATGYEHTVSIPGNISVTATDPVSGCQSQATTLVKLYASILPGLPETTEGCGFVVLDAHNPGMNYQWSNSESTQTVKITNSGTYHVTVRDNTGCSGSDTVNVTIHSMPVLDLPDLISACDGETVTIDPGLNNVNYRWGNGETSPTLSTTNAGNYWLQITDANGCKASDMSTVSFAVRPIVYLGNDIEACEGELVQLFNNEQGTSYLWTTGSTENMIEVTQSGTYALEVTNDAGCSATDAIDVVIYPTPVVDLGNNQGLCQGQSIELDAQNDNSTYVWSTSETTQQITTGLAGSYWVKVTSADGCAVISDAIDISVAPSPYKPWIPDSISGCGKAILDAGNYGASFSWNTGDETRSIETRAEGYYDVIITNEYNCSTFDTAFVEIKPVAALSLDDQVNICNNEITILDAGNQGEGFTYLWSNGETTQQIEIAGAGRYSVVITHEEGCKIGDSTRVVTLGAPVIELENDILLCKNSGLQLDAGNPGSIFIWGNEYGFSSFEQVITPDTTGKYWVQVINDAKCAATDTVTLTYTAQSLSPLFLAASNVQVGDTVMFIDLTMPEPVNWQWNFDDGSYSFDQDPSHIFYTEDTFNVKMQVDNGFCTASLTKPITVKGYNIEYMKRTGMLPPDIPIPQYITNAKVFPNPSRDWVTFDVELSGDVDIGLQLFNIQGALIYARNFHNIDKLEHHFDFSGLPDGMYIARIYTAYDDQILKIIKTQ